VERSGEGPAGKAHVASALELEAYKAELATSSCSTRRPQLSSTPQSRVIAVVICDGGRDVALPHCPIGARQASVL